ncbi:lantibiotic dehydratase [Chitinophaga qingshengii]|uniref:Lantibiotic dehydratase n=1 Tax=Chitinophaga qingshengii TaxID=1569794 RepID=A0ABR7TY38_9BACT|nr:lantibiotic dehydratase [Chitinophaga qingshengii]MBC9935055.1 lantibiotic dehydratase [Chitinophaga qingshengii]
MNNKVELHPVFTLRTPFFPISHFNNIPNHADTTFIFEVLMQDTYFMEALFLASPTLYEEAVRLRKDKGTVEKKGSKIVLSVLKYYIRMCTRCTPFGLFSGCSTGKITAHATGLEFLHSSMLRRHSRLDMDYLNNVALYLSREPIIQQYARYYPNTSLYRVGNVYRYVECKYPGGRKTYHLVSVDYSAYIDLVLQTATSGALKATLAAVVCSEEISEADANEFIDDLIASQILVSEIEPALTSSMEGEEQIIQSLANLTHRINDEVHQQWLDMFSNNLQLLSGQVKSLDHQASRCFPQNYYDIEATLKKIGIDFNRSFSIQTDLVRQLTPSSGLDADTAKDLQEAVTLLSRISLPQEDKELKDFIQAFKDRYEDMEVPLVHALDTETGIGYLQLGDKCLVTDVSWLLEELRFKPRENDQRSVDWNVSLHNFLFTKILNAHKGRQQEIILTEEELQSFPARVNKINPSFTMFVSMIPPGPTIGSEYAGYYVIPGMGGSSAANMIARFGFNEEIAANIREITKQENSLFPDAILAEIVHLPQARVGNVIFRPDNLRPYEIPYLGRSGMNEDCQLPLTDLMLSVRGDRLILRSVKLNREIIPRLTNSHNFQYDSLPIYHLLCDLQNQYFEKAFYLDVGFLLGLFRYVPRIRYKQIIFPAQWRLQRPDYISLVDGDAGDFQKNLQLLREKYQLPRYLTIVEGDNELLIDLENHWGQRLLVDELKSLDNVALKEFLFADKIQSAGNDPEQVENYSNQFLFSCFVENKSDILPVQEAATLTSRRSFHIDDEWIYFKIYLGAKTSDRFLVELYETITGLQETGLVEKWFFIRYVDADYHIRLRLRSGKQENNAQIISLIKEAMREDIDTGQVWKLQLDTYTRELERYGHDRIETAEAIFFYDSTACIQFISQLDDSIEGETIRILLAIKGMDEYLNNAGMNITEKHRWVEHHRQYFEQEFNADKNSKVTMGKIFRKLKKPIEMILEEQYPIDEDIAQLSRLVTQRTAQVLQHGPLIQDPNNNKDHTFLSGIIHMSINRIFRTRQRLYEYLLYDHLEVYYKSVVARKKILSK